MKGRINTTFLLTCLVIELLNQNKGLLGMDGWMDKVLTAEEDI